MKKRVIRNAHDAYWFLKDHPKFNVPERTEIDEDEIEEAKQEGFKVTVDQSGKAYRIWPKIIRHALDCNLDIFYTKVNHPTRGRVDKDASKNKYVECWLEFGPIYYGYAYSGCETPLSEWDDTTMLLHSHDTDLDTGAPTFDEALVKLAKLVLKHYGDYEDKHSQREVLKKLIAVSKA
jgi:hypothetical protein